MLCRCPSRKSSSIFRAAFASPARTTRRSCARRSTPPRAPTSPSTRSMRGVSSQRHRLAMPSRASPSGAVVSGQMAMSMTTGFQQSQDTPYASKDTGGKVLLDYNDLSAGIVQAAKAVTSYYIVGALQLPYGDRRSLPPNQGDTNGNPSAETPTGQALRRQVIGELHWRRQGAPARRGAHAREPDHRSDHRDGSELLPAESGRAFRAGGGEDPRERAGDCAPPAAPRTEIDFIGIVKDEYCNTARTSAIGCRSLSPRTRPTSSRRGPSTTPGSRFCRANTS